MSNSFRYQFCLLTVCYVILTLILVIHSGYPPSFFACCIFVSFHNKPTTCYSREYKAFLATQNNKKLYFSFQNFLVLLFFSSDTMQISSDKKRKHSFLLLSQIYEISAETFKTHKRIYIQSVKKIVRVRPERENISFPITKNIAKNKKNTSEMIHLK